MGVSLFTLWDEFHQFLDSWSPVVVGKFLFYGYLLTFIVLMLTATVGRRLKIRRIYVQALDKLFQFAAVKLDSSTDDNEEECLEEENVVICPESPKAALDKDDHSGEYKLHQTMPYMSAAMGAIVSDCVSKSFSSQELRTWNMLSRTRRNEYIRQSKSLTIFWLVGCFIRYVFFVPVRVLILTLSITTLMIQTSIVGVLPTSNFKKKLNRWAVMAGFEFVAGSISVTARFHDKYNRPAYGIAVSNHTSPIDFMVLATDNCYDTVGQKSKGLLGVFLSALSKSSHHIWFDRATAKDRSAVINRMETHGKDETLPPLLVFPEGCCVNNTAVIQFKKGAFELDCVVYPIAIRFDPRYGDPFWWQDSFAQYCFSMMSSWAIVCDVWYLPPMKRYPHEGAITFANRVRSAIAHKAGFVELAWDGFIKVHNKTSETWKRKESDWKKLQQTEFARHLSVENNMNQLEDLDGNTQDPCEDTITDEKLSTSSTEDLITDNENANQKCHFSGNLMNGGSESLEVDCENDTTNYVTLLKEEDYSNSDKLMKQEVNKTNAQLKENLLLLEKMNINRQSNLNEEQSISSS